MRVLFEEEVGALLAAAPAGRAVASLSCLVDLRLEGDGGGTGGERAEPTGELTDASLERVAEAMLRDVALRGADRLDLGIFGIDTQRELDRAIGLSRWVKRGCLEAGVGYAAHAIVGGALLEASVARRLSRAGARRLQVTLEARRPSPGRPCSAGEGPQSWRGVLDAVAQASAEIRLVLRVSPDATCDFEGLVDALEERGLVAAGPAVTLYLARPALQAQQARELVAISQLLAAAPAPALARALPQ